MSRDTTIELIKDSKVQAFATILSLIGSLVWVYVSTSERLATLEVMVHTMQTQLVDVKQLHLSMVRMEGKLEGIEEYLKKDSSHNNP